jgi:murein DD-endopeptidase MepM/ murein hydrolase activator NlpD
MARKKSRGSLKLILAVIVIAGLVVLYKGAFGAGPEPTLVVESDLPAIGKRTVIRVVADEPKAGLTSVKVEFVQGDRVEVLEERSYAHRESWEFWGPSTTHDEFEVVVGRSVQDKLEEGEATLRVSAERSPAWFRSPQPASHSLQMEVKLRPPQINVTSVHTYVSQGGSETVVYRVSDDCVRDGVQAGEWFFPGYALPGGGANDRFALFAAPYDLSDHRQIVLVAWDHVGNDARSPFVDRFKAKPFKTDTINLSDDFMARVTPAILSQTPELRDTGDLLENYLMINNQLRATNAATLVELSKHSREDFAWSRVFMQMRNAQVRSDFADRRTYMYNGEAVDTQDHLGFDLASTRRADIQAANTGTVVLARYFGIYGNAVAIDHGFGLMSLYGHLSEIRVEEGAEVERGAVVGLSGQTGLAGGDHLHFTMLLHGLPVNPREWWDSHWIHDRLELKLGDALPFER